jgi:hypothetical protein
MLHVCISGCFCWDACYWQTPVCKYVRAACLLFKLFAVPLATPSQLTPYFAPKSDAEELELLRSCRAKVAALSAELRRELMPAMAGAPGVMPGMPGIP